MRSKNQLNEECVFFWLGSCEKCRIENSSKIGDEWNAHFRLRNSFCGWSSTKNVPNRTVTFIVTANTVAFVTAPDRREYSPCDTIKTDHSVSFLLVHVLSMLRGPSRATGFFLLPPIFNSFETFYVDRTQKKCSESRYSFFFLMIWCD